MNDPRPTAAGIVSALITETSTIEREVTRALGTLERTQPITNAFSDVYADEALRAAKIADARPREGERTRPGILQGVPVAVKDLFDVTGHETTGSSRAYVGNLVTSDAAVVRRLREAGAIIVGKTNQHELAMGGTNLISMHGPTHNPFDPVRITGGSSGGSAAAVASGCVPIALGSDTGGSIRNPASFCGLYGLKPTQGRLPADGAMPLAPSMDCPGPLTTTIEDLSLAWWVLSGSDREGKAPARVGLLEGHFDRFVHPEVRLALARTVEALRQIGAAVVPAGSDTSEPAWDGWADVVCMELVEAHPGLADRRELLFPRTAGFVARGTQLTSEEKVTLSRLPRDARAWFEHRFEGVDLLLAPSAPYPAPRADQDEVEMGDGTTLDVHLGGTS
ncbi:MAG: amidase, partial [Actinomycetota bacterium]